MALTSDEFGEQGAKRVAASYLDTFGLKLDVMHAMTADGAALVT
jgi:hypothetical protein